MRLVALYSHPEDPQAFDEAYFNTHLPLLAEVPGLQRTEITRFDRSLMGGELYLMTVMHFEDGEALAAGLKSEEMKQAGENLQTFASDLTTLLVGQPVLAEG
ncbi:MAG: EthD family reductase [Anaerolineales bacterium]